VSWLKLSVALLSAAAIAWSSVADNPAVCADNDAREAGEHGHGTPANSSCCPSCPCHTPTVLRASVAIVERAAPSDAQLSVAHRALHSIDRPAPPTPPPTILA
jgi:hypothetical protein